MLLVGQHTITLKREPGTEGTLFGDPGIKEKFNSENPEALGILNENQK